MENIFIETAKYLLMVLTLVILGFMVVFIGLFVLAISPILPLFQKDKLIDLWSLQMEINKRAFHLR